jgi:glycosyltransferase involved in cell wall biosynthesis
MFKAQKSDMDGVSKKEVLFISAFPASHSNAIGVLTMRFAAPFDRAWKHCYWDTNMGPSEVPNSILLNSSIAGMWPFAAGRGFVTRLVERLELGWWRSDRLLESRKPQLRKMAENVGFAYAAPLRNSEATRCREILEVVHRPFVVHLWDILDEPVNADYVWLLSRAERVYCLSEPMRALAREVAGRESELLGFVRSQSKCRAAYRDQNSISIALIGFLSAYGEGLDRVAQAIELLRKHDTRLTLRYIGPADQLKYIPEALKGLTQHLGLLVEDELDRALAACNVGFLPGPFLSPEGDARSKYSIPSRVADYLAVGLPVIAAVHPESATSRFLSPLEGQGVCPVQDGESVVAALQELSGERAWHQASARCQSFFNHYCDAAVVLKDFYSYACGFLNADAQCSHM